MASNVTLLKTPAENKLGEHFRDQPGSAPRQEAFAAFAAQGLPHRRIEAWHYTDLRSLLRDAFPPAAAPGTDVLERAKLKLGAAEGARVVLVDGILVPELSTLAALPAGVAIASILDGAGAGPSAAIQAAEKLGRSESILSLNTAFLQGGAVLTVAPGTAVAEAIEIVAVSSSAVPSAVTTRSLIDVGSGATVAVVERHLTLGMSDQQGNHALVFAVADGATVEHTCAVEGNPAGSVHIGTVLARLGAEARFSTFTLAASLGTVRRQTFLEFAGEGSSCSINGVTLLDGEAHADTTLVVTHTAAHCESREYFKTILDDRSTGVYQGKVVVAPGAQKTDGKMLSKAIFLGDGANMYNKPELEIFADDVVCGHGATVGYLDDTQLFYLRARGIPLREAQSLLLNAFAADAVEAVSHEGLREALTGRIEQWLAKRHL